MENLLQQGVQAAKAGDRRRAFELLLSATRDKSLAEHAWLWLSSVVETDEERLFCLDNSIRINPANEPARRGALALRQKGVIPAALSSPAPPPQRAAPPAPSVPREVSGSGSTSGSVPHTSATGPSRLPQTVNSARPTDLQTGLSATDMAGVRREMENWYQAVALELSKHVAPAAIVKQLAARGVPVETARRIVEETRQAVRQAKGKKHRGRMLRGLLWTVGGVVITLATIFFADELGGNYVLCYGAIIFGIIDFLAGLIGWLMNA